jgi:hypothetical protein
MASLRGYRWAVKPGRTQKSIVIQQSNAQRSGDFTQRGGRRRRRYFLRMPLTLSVDHTAA